jgi:hypothetical protein
MPHRKSLAAISRIANQTNFGMFALPLLHQLGRAVARSVIDNDHLRKREFLGAKVLGDLVKSGWQSRFFVEGGNDDGKRAQ